MALDSPKEVFYRYTFRFAHGQEKQFTVCLDYGTLEFQHEERKAYPAWTALDFNQCPNCPLKTAQSPHCPVAKNLTDLIDFFRNFMSFEEVDVTVESQNRKYSKHTSLQEGVGALMGIFMVTSGCPILDKLRPMVDIHLPFLTPEETAYRFVSMYMTAQYFRRQKGKKADWNLDDLLTLLEEIDKVNKSFCKRLNAIHIKDASLNAVIILDMLSAYTGISIKKGLLKRMESLFSAHLG